MQGLSKSVPLVSLKDKLEARNKYKDTILLCDASGSMAYPIIDKITAIDLVRKATEMFEGARIYSFDSGFNVGIPNYPASSTNMAYAFYRIKEYKHKEIILISDGIPDSEQDALKEAEGLKINIIYVGKKPVPEFLIKLAAATNGKFEDIDLINSKVLEDKIKGFIGV